MSRFSKKNESRLNVSNLLNENEDGAPVVSGISTFSSPHYFVPPSGSTAQRPSNPGEGMIRFNTDSGHLEYYNSELWVDVIVNESSTIGGRGIFAAGSYNPGGGTSYSETIDYVTIATTGNAVDFGDVSNGRDVSSGCASRTRGIIAGGYSGSEEQNINYIEIATLGDGLTFGDLTSARRNRDGCGDSTRGVMGGGWSPTALIDVLTYGSTGSATQEGTLSTAGYNVGALSSSTRGVFVGGSSRTTTMDYVTIQSLGSAQDFGTLNAASGTCAGTSSSVRGIIVSNGGVIEYITISSTGNGQDFGDATYIEDGKTTTGDSTRAVLGGSSNPSYVNTINFISIATTGDASDFGDLTQPRGNTSAFSNAHGGL